jgi:surface protein
VYFLAQFYDAREFNQEISKWNVTAVTNMRRMVRGCKLLRRVTYSHVGGDFQFYSAHEFNQYIGAWDVSSVTDMSDMVRNTCLPP